MALAVTHIWDIANDLLTNVIDIYSDGGLSLPGRRYISEGTVAFDCELVAVELRRVYRGLPGQEGVIGPSLCSGTRTAEIHVWIVRCTSVPQDNGDPPTEASIEQFAQPIYIDAWFLPTQLQYRAADGSLGAACSDILIGNLNVLSPSGAFGGVDLQIDWQLGTE